MNNNSLILGWREWVSLPELGIDHLKCKVDTGARTTALHAYFVEPDTATKRVRFGIHPIQRVKKIKLICEAPFIDRRAITDSGGHKEHRYVIATSLELGGQRYPIEITLTNRNKMKFRMLLGRTAMPGDALINPNKSYQLGKPDYRTYFKQLQMEQHQS